MTEILKSAVERGASDIFVVAGLPLTYKVRGEQQRETADGAFTPEKTEAFAAEIYRLAAREPHCLNGSATDDDFFVLAQRYGTLPCESVPPARQHCRRGARYPLRSAYGRRSAHSAGGHARGTDEKRHRARYGISGQR